MPAFVSRARAGAAAVAEKLSRAKVMAAPDPARVRAGLLRWFARHERPFFWREGPAAMPLTRFQVLLVEFLLWKTNAARSESVIRRIVERYARPSLVIGRTVIQLEDELRPLGLYKRRAHCLVAFSRQLVERHGGEVPGSVAELSRLTGIGQYAARATACMLEGSRLMPVDSNTTRMFGRLFGIDGPGVRTPSAEWDARMAAFVPARHPRRFLWATMDFAAAVCTARDPRCPSCPLRPQCVTGRARVSELTVSRERSRLAR
jgi:A/G-specific adenine glycosylase